MEAFKSDLAGSWSLLVAGSSFAMSRIFAAASPSSCLEGGVTEAAALVSFCSANSRADSCSCKRFASNFSPSIEASPGARKSALLVGRASALISVLNSSTASARLVVTFAAAGPASAYDDGFGSALFPSPIPLSASSGFATTGAAGA